MSGRGDREEFGDAFDEAEDDGVENIHEIMIAEYLAKDKLGRNIKAPKWRFYCMYTR